MAQQYTNKPQVLIKRGMNITLPGDRLTGEWFQFLQNVRCFRVGEWRQRTGSVSLGSVVDMVYYLTRLNNNTDGTFRRFAGTSAGNIYVDDPTHTSFSVADTGYGGRKYSSVVSRPDRSPSPYLFLGSDTRNSKFTTAGVRSEWGLAQPVAPPVSNDNGPDYVLIDDCESSATFTPTVGALANPSRIGGGFSYFGALFDSTTPGMANIITQATGNARELLQPGMLIHFETFPGGIPLETCLVTDVIPPIANTTIESIAYDSGATGLCTIKLTSPTFGLRRNSVVALGGFIGGEFVRVLSVTMGLDGIPSFRCSTVGTYIAGTIVDGTMVVRTYLTTNYASLSVIYDTNYVSWTGITVGLQNITKTSAINLATANVYAGGLPVTRPIQEDDFFHISLRAVPSEFTEIQIQVDVSNAVDFATNYYYVAIRPSDLQAAIDQTQAAINAQQLDVQRQQLSEFVYDQSTGGLVNVPPGTQLGDLTTANSSLNTGFDTESSLGPASVQVNAGQNQWTEFFIPISDFQRVGVGNTDWKDAAAFRVTIQALTTTTLGIDAVYIGGTHGPDNPELPGYSYVYRARNTTTGARSNPSPPTRYNLNVRRQLITVQIPSYPDSQADVVDVFRLGGILGDYYLIGSIPNTGGTFNDDIPDSIAIRSPILEFGRFKPWVSSETPKSGICNVVGTTVLRQSGDQFNTNWVRGTQIKINNKFYSLYTKPTSVNFLELNESAGTQTNVSWQIIEPVLEGQAFPNVFGPYSGSSAEFNFAVGDPRNPGYLYWTNGNDTESTSDVNALEICPPSEILLNGCVLDGIVYVFSDKQSWRILPSFEGGQSGAGSVFYPQKTAMGKGLASRWGLAVGDAMYFVSYDGIYTSRGDAIQSLTDESLAPLFRRDISEIFVGVPIAPISFDPADSDEISLIYSLDGLYFTYKGVDGVRYTLYYSFLTQGWMLDSLATGEIIRTYREVQYPQEDQITIGTSNGLVLLKDSSFFADNGSPISCRVWDREEIWDSLRATKQVGDTMIDADPQNATITPTMRYEGNTSSDVLTTLVGNGRTQYVRDINSGLGRVVRGAALDLTWSNGTVGAPRVYAWEPAAFVKPEESVNRASDWDNGGYTGTKWLQGFRVRGDTEGLAKSFDVQIDGGTTVEGFTFTANGEQVQTFWLTNPVVAHEMRMLGTDGDLWRNMGVEWIFEPEPEMAGVWETQVTSFGLPFYMHMREVMIAHRSTTDITMNVITDGVTNSYTIPNGGGQRVRSYLPVQGIKAKYHKFRFTSAQPFGLWIEDIECRVGAWGRTDNYTVQRPFGDISRSNGGARI